MQKVKVMDKNGNFVEVLAMLDSGSNTSLLSKSAAGRLGLNGAATRLTMNLAGGKKKSDPFEIIDVTVAPPARIMEFRLQLGRHPSREYSANMVRECPVHK